MELIIILLDFGINQIFLLEEGGIFFWFFDIYINKLRFWLKRFLFTSLRNLSGTFPRALSGCPSIYLDP